MQVHSHDRDANFGRSIYGYGFRRGKGYDSRKRGDHVYDAQGLSWERDECPGRRQECSWPGGHDYSQRSRSPHIRSHREDNYDDKRNHEHSSVVPSIYDSDFRRGNGYYSWKRPDHYVRDAQSLNWDRDECPGRRRERSWSRGHDYRHRSRSPHVRSHSRSYREDNYDNNKRNRGHSSVVPSSTVKVLGLSKRTTAKDLCGNLAEWGPFLDARVIKERNSSSCSGTAFIDFPSVVKARTMMDAIGYDGLSVDGMMLHFEYSFKKIKSEYQRMHEKRRRQVKWRKAIERGATGATTQLQQEEDKVLAELVEEEGEVEDREEEQMVEDEEEEVEKSEAEDVLEGEGDARDSEEEGEAKNNDEEGEAENSEAEQMVEEGGNEGVDLNEGDGEESEEEELQQGRVSTKKKSNKWTESETNLLEIGIDLLSGETKPWTEILRLGSHIFHPKRTAEQLREKDRRMRGDTHRMRTKGRMNGDTGQKVV